MRKSINISPPSDFADFSPSELFRFFYQIGHWTEESFSDEFQAFTRGKLVSTVTISKWKNKDVIPTRYSGPFFKMIESLMDPYLAKDWISAFETVWAHHSAGRTQNQPQTETSAFSDVICSQHRKWIEQLYAEKRAGDAFSPSDIYVPLQLNEFGNDGLEPIDVEDLIDLITETENTPSDIDWILVSGGPGAGKSMSALHMANAFCQVDVFPIYIRGSRLSYIDIDVSGPDKLIIDSFSLKSFLKHFRASSFDTACLILDGLDEISRAGEGSTTALSLVISELKIEQAACAAHNKNLHVIALGRDAHVEFTANQLSSVSHRSYELLALDGSLRSRGNDLDCVQGEDLRPMWWKKYLSATNNTNDPSLPDYLSTEYDDFSEFGSDPLLSYLICQTALGRPNESQLAQLPHERVNALTYASNKNKLYKSIIELLALGVRHKLDAKRFLSVLQHMALAAWHMGEGRSVSLETIFDCIHDSKTKASFQALNLSDNLTHSPPDILITAFYYRLAQDENKPEKTVVEFTHKTFSEYLVSTLIFDRFIRLISAYEGKSKFDRALKDWVDVSHAGEHEPSLADFCQKEAAVRYEDLSHLNWDSALIILRNTIGRSGLSSIVQIQSSSSLLFFIWSCLNLERQKFTGQHFPLSQDTQPFSSTDLKAFQRSNVLNFKSGSLTEPILQNQTFLTHSLSATHLKSADMSQLSFSLGHIENPICEDTSFAMTHWSHVKVTAGLFIRSVFQQAIFYQWRVFNTRFSHCFFQGSRFQGAIFSGCHFEDTFFSQCHFSDVEFDSSQFGNIIFDRCVFTHCAFSRGDDTKAPFDAQFRHCTFMEMSVALKNIPEENIENTIFQNLNENAPASPESHGIEKGLSELL